MENLDRPGYRLVSPEMFTREQKQFVDKFKELICSISSQTDLIFGAKDIHSKHFMSTDSYAKLVKLNSGHEVTDRFDRDMPCDGTAEFAHCYVQEDQALLRQPDIDKKISVLNIHEYGIGIRALVFDKQIMKHQPSRSILGTIYRAREIEIANFFALLPNYAREFGIGCSVENCSGELNIDNVRLSDYEHEVCFLLIMNWDCRQIADFLNKHRPGVTARSADTIYKCKNRICNKLGIANCSSANLREMLVSIGAHRKMPKLFFSQILGSKLI